MTVKLIRAYNGFAAGASYDDTADIEQALVNGGNAVWDLRKADTGGGPGNRVPLNTYTAAQLSAMAAAGGLTPFATYVPSDAVPPYQLWARSATELVSPSGASLIPVSYPGLVGSLVEF